jgi:hypothetical protein
MTIHARTSDAISIATPSVHAQLYGNLGIEASNALADLVTVCLQQAITEHENQRHAQVFRLYHGLKEDGTWTTPMLFREIAAARGVTRTRITGMYYRAATPIFARLSNALLLALKELVT